MKFPAWVFCPSSSGVSVFSRSRSAGEAHMYTRAVKLVVCDSYLDLCNYLSDLLGDILHTYKLFKSLVAGQRLFCVPDKAAEVVGSYVLFVRFLPAAFLFRSVRCLVKHQLVSDLLCGLEAV